METSNPVATGDRVTLLSPTYDRPYCMSFWYHMRGSTMGTLYVKIVDGNTLFTITGNQGNTWHNWKVDVSNDCNPYQVSLNLLFNRVRKTHQYRFAFILNYYTVESL